ncbi:MAG TPA: acetyl-CoA C-acyltransferase [Candidatus Marinimicrobia bacterium]|jgi:acetyl-CoA acetyltransferase family protein|nr:thiolase family protein [Candidatus Neomarinimicrobiota bacterium]MDP6230311.1 thiolase family protein [Candidatus Neomarinimicrobiota bacterium]MDP7095637.1 thiolase family protein [Candidatus Neomarinimicrobiota bacterium]MDP7165973.1 thiolase family protein [Candidatus Neomarinimicrobiota bacterium]MDP7512840.1 thiolase family protein [Candidatus Neomarinimicrobiota bacterium]|tara:strand:- start:178 stop:1308 length:1131 start_codon:yes stop_codon:yes gene_type:complete
MSIKSVIIDAVRSPIGLKNGQLIGIRPDDLAAQVVKGLLGRNESINPTDVEDVVVGCAFPEGPQGMIIGKSVGVLAGLPKESTGKVVNRFCGSSMDAVHQLSTAIVSGDIDVGIAVGVEDMFSVPMGGFAPDFHPELAEQEFYIGMGETAENLANDENISREDQDEFSIKSHEKALQAYTDGKFDNELIPIDIYGEATVDRDEGPREPDTEKIKNLNPAFVEGGSVTAASSSPISIGASAILITSDTFAEKTGLTPRAEIVARAIAGVDWTHMGAGPLPATEKVLSKAGLGMDDIETIELNEAFAAQSLYVIRKGGWDMNKINLNGGAIALGHPLGCSGARILVTLLNVMEQQDTHTGLATMCIGSGQGIATIIKR